MDTVAAVIQALLAAVFFLSGGLKLIGVRMQIDNFNRYGYPQWFRVVTGVVELAGAAGMVAGLFADEVAIAAAVLLAVTMLGAAYTDLRKSAPVMVAPPIVLLGLSIAVVALRASS